MNGDQVLQLLEEEMEKHCLLDYGWTYQLDEDKKQFGCCCFEWRVISISRPLAVSNTENHALNTIRHEIAHALVGEGHWHDEVWRLKAIEIGCNGEEFHNCFVKKVPPRSRVPDDCSVIHLPYEPRK